MATAKISTPQFLILLLLCTSVMLTASESFWESTLNRLFDQFGLRNFVSEVNEARNGRLLVSSLDRIRGLLVIARHLSLSLVSNQMEELFRQNRKRGKMQRIVPQNESFPCNITNQRSTEPPISVNRLRPGDIDVVATIGDSLAAGNALISTRFDHTLNEYRGLTFSGGGIGNWRIFLTLPNILKVYNPKLYGYSTGNGLVVDEVSRLNVAEPMIMSRDLLYQTNVLISRMRQDPNIDMQRHWKLLTLFIGNNDICTDMCHYDRIEEFYMRHERDLNRTLSLLRDNVPRLLVNIISPPNMVTTIRRMEKVPLLCHGMHLAGCHCVFSERYNVTHMLHVWKQIKRWQQVDERVATFPEFQTEDFAVVYHPFLSNPTMRTLSNGDIDYRYFADDCFHFSQLGHAGMANALWNSILQPIGKKQKDLLPAFETFECPTAERPYLATLGNSRK